MEEYNYYNIKELAGKEVVGFKFNGNSFAPWKDEYEDIIGKTGTVLYCNTFLRILFIEFDDIKISVPLYEFCRREPYQYKVDKMVYIIHRFKRESDGVEYDARKLGRIISIKGTSFEDMIFTVSLFDDGSGSFKGRYKIPYEQVRPSCPRVMYY